jgi:hypothetical protein
LENICALIISFCAFAEIEGYLLLPSATPDEERYLSLCIVFYFSHPRADSLFVISNLQALVRPFSKIGIQLIGNS